MSIFYFLSLFLLLTLINSYSVNISAVKEFDIGKASTNSSEKGSPSIAIIIEPLGTWINFEENLYHFKDVALAFDNGSFQKDESIKNRMILTSILSPKPLRYHLETDIAALKSIHQESEGFFLSNGYYGDVAFFQDLFRFAKNRFIIFPEPQLSVQDLCRSYHMKCLVGDLSIRLNEKSLEEKLKRAEKIAILKKNVLLTIHSADEERVRILEKWLVSLEKKGIKVISLKELYENLSKEKN